MLEIAQWVAPIATMIAAVMTAANLGARITGWGFVVFTIGAVAWIAVGVATGQHGLLLSNAFLLIADIFGIWRWLGRQARYDEGAEAASNDSRKDSDQPTLFALSKIEGRPVTDASGRTIGKAVDAMAGCRDGTVKFFVVSRGGIGGVGEELYALGWGEAQIEEDAVRARIDLEALVRRPVLNPSDWPHSAEAAGVPA